MSATTVDPATLTPDELDIDIALARTRAAMHITKCGRDHHGTPRCAHGRDAMAEQDELLDIRLRITRTVPA